MLEQQRYDVAILGSGMAGSILGAILVKQGFRVVLIEKDAHPRFAIGEALLPQSAMWLFILGERFGIPEIRHLARTDTIYRHVGPRCGTKRTIGFLYHEEGRRQDPAQSNLLVPPAQPITMESHLFRQDVDLYLLEVARSLGVDYRERTEVVDLDFERDGVELSTATGGTIRARYLIDGSGYRSLVADRMGLREEPCPLETCSRTLFTHLRGMPLYDDTLAPEESPGLSARWSDGTLHHVFDGGWFWVIPFHNYPGSENPLTSIGLSLDARRFPARPGVSPEAEFREVAARYPSIARHVDGAEPVRHFTATGRLQYSSSRAAGERYFLMAHAYGFVDPLYSRGLISTLEVIHALALPLAEALAADDFDPRRFAAVESLQKASLLANDRMVASSYRAFGHYATWNAWLRVWLIEKFFGDLRLFSTCVDYLGAHDPAIFDRLLADPLSFSRPEGESEIDDLFRFAEARMKRVEAGEIAPEAAAEEIFARFAVARCTPPIHAWGDPRATHLDYLPEKLMRTIQWGKTEAPAILRDRLFAWDPSILGPPPGGERAAA